MKPAVAFLLGALAVGALGMAPGELAPRVTHSFATAHIGDTVSDYYTVSTDTVSVVLWRPPGSPSRVWLSRCGVTRHFSRKRIGSTVIAADTLFVTVTGSDSACAHPPPLIRTACWPGGTRTDSAKFAAAKASADTTTDPALTDVPCT